MRRSRWIGSVVIAMAVVAIAVGWRGCGGASRSAGPAGSAPASAGAAVPRRLATIRGAVTEEGTQRPVVGATVGVQGGPGSSAVMAVTGADGGFEVEVAAGRYQVRAAAAGFVDDAPAWLQVAAGDTGTVTLVMRAARSGVAGVVGDALAGPLDGATVEAVPLGAAREAPRVVQTDGAGRYQLALPPGAFALTARFDGYVAVTRRVLIAREPRAEDFKLMPAGTIRGHVLRAADRAPVAGACVVASATDELAGLLPAPSVPCVASAADGGFEVTGLAPGSVGLVATAPGLGQAVALQIPISVGQTRDGVELLLDPATDVRGVVVDQDQRPIADVPVVALRTRDLGLVAARAVSDADGTFTLVGLTAERYVVRTTPTALALETATASVDVPRAQPVTLQVRRGVRIDGVVTPPRAGRVSVRRPLERVGFGELATAAAAETLLTATIDVAGRFVLDAVPPGAWEITATTETGAGAVVVEVGAAPQQVTIALDQLASVCGVVRERDGRPLPTTTVAAMAVAQASALPAAAMRHLRFQAAHGGAPVGADGSFCVRDLTPGAYLLVVRDDARALPWSPRMADPAGNVRPIELTVGEARSGYVLEVVAQLATLRGRVVDAAGAPVADALITAERAQVIGGDADAHPLIGAQLPVGPAVSDAAGEFVMQVSAEPQRLTVEQAARGLRTVVASADPTAPVLVQLEPAAQLRGVATGGDGACRINVTGPRETVLASAAVDCAFTATDLTPGSYDVAIRRGAWVGTAHATVSAGDMASVTVALEREATVTGRVVDRDGVPRRGAIVLLVGGDRVSLGAALFEAINGAPLRTDDAGRFTAAAAPGAAVVAVLSADGQAVNLARPIVVTAPATALGDLVTR